MKKLTVLGIASACLLSSAALSTAVSAWGDSAGGRKFYTIDEINSGVLGNNIVLNSISTTDEPTKEKDFVVARDASATTFESGDITVENGKEYIISMYVHNNNPNGTDAIAKDVTTTFAIPGTSGTSVEVNGIISSSNANPGKYWDNIVFKSKDGSSFHLEYVSGSALLENNGIGANGGATLSDDIISSGVKIGYDALDGNVPGCYQYDNYVSVRVKAVYDTFEFTKQVRLVGEKEWQESVDAKVGDKVEFQLIYKNVSSATQTGVIVRDSLPSNLQLVAGTTKVYNAAYTSGLTYEDTISTTGINLGSYTKDSNVIVRFTAEVVDSNLSCGKNTMNNIAQVFVNDSTIKGSDDASVVTTKTCSTNSTNTTSTELPKTGLDGVATSALGLGSVVTALGCFIKSKKLA